MKLNINMIALCLATVGTVTAAPVEKDRNDPVYRAELEKECGPLGVMDVPPGFKESEVRHCREHPLGHTRPGIDTRRSDACDGPERDRNDPVYRAELEKECGDLGVMEVPPGYKECEVRHCREHPLGHSRPGIDTKRSDACDGPEKDRNDPVYRAELEKECGDLGVMEVPPGFKECEVRHCREHPLGNSGPGSGPTKGEKN